MHYVIAFKHQVNDPQQTVRFFVKYLGFQAPEKEGYPFYVENGATSIIFEQGEPQTLLLELQCNHVEKEAQNLLQHTDITCLQNTQQHDNRIECRLQCRDNIQLHLTKVLNEDDLDLLLPLPKSLVWNEKTEMQIRRMLRLVPLGFRESARQRVTEKAEYMAVEQGELMVDESCAMKSIVTITPQFQHRALMESMQHEGINDTLYLDINKIEM